MAKNIGWEEASDGDLLQVAEAEFDTVLIGDKKFRYQQNLRGCDTALVVLLARRNIYQTMAPLIPQVLALLPTIQPGQFYFVPPTDNSETVT